MSSTAIPIPALALQQSTVGNVASLSTSAGNMYTPLNPNAPHPGSLTPQHNQPSSTPVSTPNASPRPSILRKRTNEG